MIRGVVYIPVTPRRSAGPSGPSEADQTIIYQRAILRSVIRERSVSRFDLPVY